MEDKELLKLAATAAGMKHPAYMDLAPGVSGINRGPMETLWNPLTDDGDALRLAVALRIEVEPWIHGDSACARAATREVLIDEPHYGDDPERATRRAIVRAAAALATAPDA